MSLNKFRPVQMNLNEPKAKMDPNEPKWAQKTLNIFKMISYELKIGRNELKLVSLNKLERA